MPLPTTLENLLQTDALIEVFGGLRSRQYELFVEDLPVGILKTEGTLPKDKGLFVFRDTRVELIPQRRGPKQAECRFQAILKGHEIATFEVDRSQRTGRIIAQGQREFRCEEPKGKTETIVSDKNGARLFTINGGSEVGLRTVRLSPTNLGLVEWQSILALVLYHLITSEI